MSYAQALFELAQEEKSQTEIYNAALVLKKCIAAEARYLDVISSPVIRIDERLALIKALLSNAPVLLKNTVLLLCENNKIGYLNKMLEKYIAYYREDKQILEVTVVSAIPLTDDGKERLETALEKRFEREILLETEVDQGCIGGLKLQMNGIQYDGSLARQLDEIGNLLFDNTHIMGKINSAKAGDKYNA